MAVRRQKTYNWIEVKAKMMQQKLVSIRAQNKIYKDFADRLSNILAEKQQKEAFSRPDLSGLFDQGRFRDKASDKTRVKKRKKRPATTKQLNALKRGRKILAMNRK